ncbi:hypothetical protein CcaverHIS002_0307260 [Cutaneotrichosporon cavernicola]|uniref:Uncharacterized protein n=1 Tax=Cutaneotrichosporon cavernicola TaxID=279322 RepID=A0AA48ICZ9_9TREE|nr:uncharacterized protein CcaverHIS019_0307170 [Cutaneotrichosporon cavernicola]BEI82858.1 hypothetical protein CcaverHIS002_0307260 [Cutaneotrichosporon cavernicola]BEI90647.1 hypothetical protein CcaverHIS019_0307170 [Cutaneotrichosporon cavernicola]BEI98425.1 hypothetical protein CcaverHIS631_0307240 [Cutaneotrichosporon cavernicola]BEJ06198.1 hypothetical protein CcaverHIS641_0307200 [Cutaneotrichosporon cavernicola]
MMPIEQPEASTPATTFGDPLAILGAADTGDAHRREALGELGVNELPAGFVPWSVDLLRSVPDAVGVALTGETDPAVYLGTKAPNAGEAAKNGNRPTQTSSNVLRTPSEAKEADLTAMTLMLRNAAVIERLADLASVSRVNAQIDLARLKLEAVRAGQPVEIAIDGIDVGLIETPYQLGPREAKLAQAKISVTKAAPTEPNLLKPGPKRAPRRKSQVVEVEDNSEDEFIPSTKTPAKGAKGAKRARGVYEKEPLAPKKTVKRTQSDNNTNPKGVTELERDEHEA